jgi:cell division protein FtsI (penicillin-binding protein 3)
MRRWRFVIVYIMLGVGAIAVFGKYVHLVVSPKASLESQNILVGERGRITDRNGRILAMDIPKYNVSVWRPDVDEATIATDARELSTMLGVPYDEIMTKFAATSLKYFYIARRLTEDAITPLLQAQKKGRFKGINVEEIPARLYPEGKLASHLIGFTGEGNKGLDGIEIKYDKELEPKPAKVTDNSGQLINPSMQIPRGDTVELTIDAELQFMLEQTASKAMIDNKAEAVFIIGMDIKTGEVLAYVSMPDFDPNTFNDYSSADREDRLSVYSYEPGSVFKIFSLSSILDSGGITPYTIFNCDGAYRRTLPNGQKIVIKDLGVYGKQDMAGILSHSSNAGTGYASDRISETDFYNRLRAYGFGTPTGLGLTGENPGFLRDPSKWSARSKPTIAIGQEVRVTALQMITAAAAVANGGILLKPTTVKRILSPDGTVLYNHEAEPIRRVISEQTAHEMMTALETVASMEGTGWRAKVPDVRMAVKTGTAQMIDPKTHAYSDTDYIASTLDILPADKPQIALYVVIVKPMGSSYLGGQIAAPILKDATEAALTRLDIPRGKTPTVIHSDSITIRDPAPVQIGTTMPDLTGTPKRLLLPLLERSDINVKLSGDGYVRSQDPIPGTNIQAGMTITLTLQ